MTSAIQVSQMDPIESVIHFIRGHKVMLDSDLAVIFGTTAHRLNEQFKRNRSRFPSDFAFQLTHQELRDLRSQFAISKGRGGKRYLPWAFTEHGAIMLASVLSSPVAIEASVRVVRAFVHLREILANNKQLETKFKELERRLDGHDGAIKKLFDAIRELLKPEPEPARREIGFHIKEQAR